MSPIFYEQNYNNTHTFTQVETKFVVPVGISVQGTYTWNSGVRLDLGLGPIFWMRDLGTGDFDSGLEHTEIPVSATVGYTFYPRRQCLALCARRNSCANASSTSRWK